MARDRHDGPRDGGGFGFAEPRPDDDIVVAAALRGLADRGQGRVAPVPAAHITERGDRVRRRRLAVLAAVAVVVFGGVSGVVVGVSGSGEETVRPAGGTEAPAPSSGDSPPPSSSPTSTPSPTSSAASPPASSATLPSGSVPPPTRTYPPTSAVPPG
ncbi:hypothetical protein GCM10010252_67630 [Streptomyces aureoverticillatus]|nr:hypothetical protein GCM10010252_67630 [Streptomyces aureoverticillatus]